MKKILFILSFFVSFVSFGQVYQLMPQYGYQANRMNFDSTLQIPTTCGVPTLRTVVNVKRAAIAFDSCNNRFYQYNPKTSAWSVISGVDTTSLSNRINTKIDSLKRSTDSIFARVNGVWKFQYKDSIGGTTIDTTSLSNRINTKIDSLKRSTDSVFARVNGVWKFQYKDSTGGGSTPSLQAVTDVGNTTDKSITIGVGGQQGLLNLNTWNNDDFRNKFIDYNGEVELFGGGYFQVIDSFSKNMSIQFGNTNGGSGTSNYIGQKSTAINTNVPTIELNSYNKSILITPDEQVYKNDVSNSLTLIPDYFGYDDTLNYPRNNGVKDTIATVYDVRQKLNISDTTNKWVTSVTKVNDSTIRVVKNTTTTDITLTPAATVTAATRLVTTVYNNSGSTITKGSVVYINGRHSSNLPTIALAQANTEGNSYSTFALIQDDITNGNSGIAIQAGNITNLNLPTSSYTDGEVVYLSPTVAGGITTNKNSVLAPNHIVKIGTITRAHPTAGGIEIKIENGWQLDELSDVQIPIVPNDSTLLQFSRVDSLWHSVSVNNAIGTKYIKPSDTATMLTPYLRKVDTTGKFVNNITRTEGKDSIIFFIGGTRYAIKDSVGAGGGSYTFSTGLTNTSGTITSNLSTGVSGGQSVVGGTAASNSLTLSSTTNATKGKLLFGTSAYDEVNNRLGIGTASPTNDFTLSKSVNGNTDILNFNSSTGTSALSRFIVRNDTNNEGQLFASGSNWSGYGSMTGNAVGFYSSLLNGIQIAADGNFTQTRIQFMTGTTPSTKMVIQNNGNVQIGTTTDAGYKLDVNGTARAVTSLQTPTLLGNTTSGGTLTLQSTSNATKGKILFGTSAYDEVNNRLGIGTTSPSEKFEITGTDYAFLRTSVTNTTGNNETGFNFLTYDGTSVAQNGGVTSTNSTFNYQAYGANATVLFSSKSGGLGLMSRNAAAGNIRFYTGGDASGNERMRIFNGGNVAIGTSTDAGYKLDVNGTARANQFQLSALNTAPATSSSTGTTGEIRIVNGFIYICVATNTWQRATLSTW